MDLYCNVGNQGGASGKEHAGQYRRLRDGGWISGLGRYPRVGNSNPLQYSCLENPMDQAMCYSHGVHQEQNMTEMT